FALLKIDIAELRVMMGLVEMVNLGLKILDAAAIHGAGQFEAACRRRRTAVDVEEIPKRADAGENQHEHHPKPFPAADGIDDHPDLENAEYDKNRGKDQGAKIQQL